MTILCYGDSNTYGYDPRGPIPGRYPADFRWCDLLAQNTSWNIINGGENGRIVPEPSWGYTDLKRMLTEHGPVDMTCIMLGTNDILISSRMDVTPIIDRMDALLDYLQAGWPDMKLVLITPPPIDIPELPEINKKRETLTASYREIAADRSIGFIDVSSWDLPLAYDGAHFSQKGHQIFAENIKKELLSFITG